MLFVIAGDKAEEQSSSMFDPAVSYLNPEPVMKWEMILDNSNVCEAEINFHLKELTIQCLFLLRIS